MMFTLHEKPFDLPDYTCYFIISKDNKEPVIIKGGLSLKDMDQETVHKFMNNLSKAVAETYTKTGVVSET